MSFFTKIFRFLRSSDFFTGLVVSASLVLAGFYILYRELGIWDIVSLVPSITLLALILLNRLSWFFFEFKERKNHILFSLGVLITIAGLLINYAYRFEDIVSLGEGEKITNYTGTKGPLLKSFPAPVSVEAIEGDPLQPAETDIVKFQNDKGKALSLTPGQSMQWGKGILKVLRTEPAPLFVLRDSKGRDLHAAYVKLDIYPSGKEDHFSSPALPHRFYVSLTGKKDKPLSVKVLRGKLTIANGELSPGEELYFEKLRILFPEVSHWVEIELRYYPGNKALIGGFITALAGLLVMIVFRKKKTL